MNILAISPHTDDIELFASGLLLRLNKHNIRHIALSPATQSIPDGFDPLDTRKEFDCAQEVLGIHDHRVYDIEVREFPKYRQDVLDILITERDTFKPDIVISASAYSVHQDHKVVGEEVMRAFFDSTILSFLDIRSVGKETPNFIIELSDTEWSTKEKAFSCYKTQMAKDDYIKYPKATSDYYSQLYGYAYCEVFVAVKRFWGLNDELW